LKIIINKSSKLILKKKIVLPIFGLYQKIKKNPELLIGMKNMVQN